MGELSSELMNHESKEHSARPLFYRGDMDHKVVTAENGARVNEDYLTFIRDGAWGEVRCEAVCDGVHVVTGFGYANSTFIETHSGWILVDTGTNMGSGVELLKLKEQFSDKPVVAIIYSHHHYTAGAAAILEKYPDIEIYAHPQVEQNLLGFKNAATMRGGQTQVGQYLPEQGEDARVMYGFNSPSFADPALNGIGHVSPTRLVANGETVTIDGLDLVFYHTAADATDSLIVHYPKYDLVTHNAAIMPMLFPLYTLRAESYRVPQDLIAGIDRIRSIRPEYMIGCHGFPVVGKAAIYELITDHRDAYAYLYQQTIRGINKGLNPEELVAAIKLPQHLSEQAHLFPAYIDVEYIIRGIYRGFVGWWGGDPADLHPPEPAEYHGEILQGFGGADNLIAAAERAFTAKKYNLTAKLLSTVLAVQPDHSAAKQLKANALRAMAQATPTGIQTRNFLLTNALHLEGKLDKNGPPPSNSLPPANADMALKTPPGTYIQLMENHIDPSPVIDLTTELRFTFTDIDRSFGLALRWGAVEFMDNPTDQAPLSLELPRPVWASIATGQQMLSAAVQSGEARQLGDDDLWQRVQQAFASVWGE
jgi:alkyl sulfatase BDS1-like metallo-beta-lactamase superfamily hydrolase